MRASVNHLHLRAVHYPKRRSQFQEDGKFAPRSILAFR